MKSNLARATGLFSFVGMISKETGGAALESGQPSSSTSINGGEMLQTETRLDALWFCFAQPRSFLLSTLNGASDISQSVIQKAKRKRIERETETARLVNRAPVGNKIEKDDKKEEKKKKRERMAGCTDVWEQPKGKGQESETISLP